MSKLEAMSKIAALAYLLWLCLSLRERKGPPCETCKHLDEKMVCFQGESLQYCKRYEPRNEKEGTPDA